jgi:hypothetical protein
MNDYIPEGIMNQTLWAIGLAVVMTFLLMVLVGITTIGLETIKHLLELHT